MLDVQKEFIRMIHKEYVDSGLTLSKFSMKIGMSTPALSYLFKGKRGLGFDLMFQVAEILNIDIGALQKKYKGRGFKGTVRSYRVTKVDLSI